MSAFMTIATLINLRFLMITVLHLRSARPAMPYLSPLVSPSNLDKVPSRRSSPSSCGLATPAPPTNSVSSSPKGGIGSWAGGVAKWEWPNLKHGRRQQIPRSLPPHKNGTWSSVETHLKKLLTWQERSGWMGMRCPLDGTGLAGMP